MANQELQKELELQIGLKQEIEVAMKLLEKDTHEKQDTLVALRQQLDQVKNLNLQMFNKAQVLHLVVWTKCSCNRITCNQLKLKSCRLTNKESDRVAQKKVEDMQALEKKMIQMEAAMKELEQRCQDIFRE